MESISVGQLWVGRVLSGLAVAFLFIDAVGKLLTLAPVVEGTVKLGYADGVVFPLGVLLLTGVILVRNSQDFGSRGYLPHRFPRWCGGNTRPRRQPAGHPRPVRRVRRSFRVGRPCSAQPAASGALDERSLGATGK